MSHLTPKERKRYTDVFNEVDANGDGFLSMSEVGQLCQSLGFTFDDEQIKELFAQLDVDKSGDVTLDEFLSVMQPIKRKDKRSATYRRMFKKLDKNKDGVLTARELYDALSSASDEGGQLDMSQVEQLITQADHNSDGMLNYEEFITLLKPLLES